MKKTLLTERFQQLAGIRPLYTLNEGIIDNLKVKVQDFKAGSMDKIKSIVGSVITPLAKSNEDKVEDIINKNPKITQELGELEALKNSLEVFLKNYKVGEDSDLQEAKGGVADLILNITAGLGSLSGGMLAATGLFGFGKEEANIARSGWNSVVNTVGKGLDWADVWGSSGAIDQVSDITWTFGSPTQYAIALAALLAVSIVMNKIKSAQTNENVGVDVDSIINMTLAKV
jgi:hypothetical protein